MTEQTINRIVPALRFPEFQGKDTWKFRLLSDVLFEHNLRSTGREDVFSVSVHKGVINQIEHLGRSFSAANTDHYKLVNDGDVIYTKSPTGDFPYGIVKQSKVGKAVITSPLYGVFRPETIALGRMLDGFFEYRVNNMNYLASLVQKGAKNTINIRNDVFLSKGLPLPTDKSEQQKISDTLSSLDDLLTAENQKLEALKAHKKGLMQQLFPIEGETRPALRFDEFMNSGDWVEKRLGEIAKNLDAKRIPITESERVKGNIPYYGASGIIDYVEDFIFNERLLCISEDGANLVARSYPIAFVIDGKTWVNNHSHVLRFEHSFTETIVEKYLNQINLEPYLTGMAQPKLNRAKLDIIPIPLPKSESEQQKIADLLSSTDTLISAQSARIDQLKQHKKGLMQGLFPKLNEVA